MRAAVTRYRYRIDVSGVAGPMKGRPSEETFDTREEALAAGRATFEEGPRFPFHVVAVADPEDP